MPSLDVLGWFARDARLFAEVGRLLLPAGQALAAAATADARHRRRGRDRCRHPCPACAGLRRRRPRFGAVEPIRIAPDGLENWRTQFRLLSAAETWSVHGAWIEAGQARLRTGHRRALRLCPRGLGPRRGAGACGARRDRPPAARDRRRRRHHLPADRARPRAAAQRHRRGGRSRSASARNGSTCIAGLSGLPQISIPAATVDGAPVGLSLIGPPGRDLDLLALAVELEPHLKSNQTKEAS